MSEYDAIMCGRVCLALPMCVLVCVLQRATCTVSYDAIMCGRVCCRSCMSEYDAIMCGKVMHVCANVCASACLAMHGIVMHDALRCVIV